MTPITGVLLCGGEGRRFGGREKPLLELRGQPLAGHVLARLAPQVAAVVISANRRLNDYAALGFPVVGDRSSDQGPLAGILAAAEAVSTPLLFVCPGDSPFLPRDLVRCLRERLAPGLDAVVPYDGSRSQHLFMLVRRSAALTILPYLDAGGRDVHGWLSDRTRVEVAVVDRQGFVNVNSPSMLARLEADESW